LAARINQYNSARVVHFPAALVHESFHNRPSGSAQARGGRFGW